MNSARRLALALSLMTLAVMNTACDSGFQGVSDKTSLVSQPLFTNLASTNATSITSTTCDGPCPTPTATPAPTATPISTTSVPVQTVCSSDDVNHMGGSVKSATNLTAQLVNSSGQVACSLPNDSLRTTIINERSVPLPANVAAACPNLPAGSYALRLKSGTSGNLLSSEVASTSQVTTSTNFALSMALPGFDPGAVTAFYNFFYNVPNDFPVTVASNGQVSLASTDSLSGKAAVLYNINTNPGLQSSTTTECTVEASPLLIQLIDGQEQPEAISLLAPLSGIRFDILGRNAAPVAHTRNQISWLSPAAARHNYFLVLPNKRGAVNGIDEMFGNNTMGPDGAFAANGYEALRKYDGLETNGTVNANARDGVISANDAVFSSLRLWSDENGDGIAQSSELHSLDELGVVSIDLNYDAHYSEMDKYGNEIKMKSAATTKDGLKHVVYDIWFRIVD